MAEAQVFAEIALDGVSPIRAQGMQVIDLHPALEAALARQGLGGFLGRPAMGNKRVAYAGEGVAGLVPFQDADEAARAGGRAALTRLVAALDDPELGGWLASALLTVGDAPLLTGARGAVLGGWGLIRAEQAQGPLAPVLAAGIGRFEPLLVERAGRFYAPAATWARWVAPAGAGALVGLALGVGLWLGWPVPSPTPEQVGQQSELARLRTLASGDVCRIPPGTRL